MLLWMTDSDWERETHFLPKNTPRGTKPLTTGEARTVVLLDNDEEIRTVMALGLEHHHFRVLQARTPAEAAHFRRHHPTELLVADVGVLQPQTVEALRPIEVLPPKIKVLLISGHDRATVEDCYEGLLTGREFLQKPFSSLLLATVLQQMAQ
jgi:DNA-binding NtrC family response regulator